MFYLREAILVSQDCLFISRNLSGTAAYLWKLRRKLSRVYEMNNLDRWFNGENQLQISSIFLFQFSLTFLLMSFGFSHANLTNNKKSLLRQCTPAETFCLRLSIEYGQRKWNNAIYQGTYFELQFWQA